MSSCIVFDMADRPDELERQGLIARRFDPADRRVNLLSITPDGRRVRAEVQAAIQRKEEVLLAQLSAADRRSFLRALQTLSGSV